MGAYRAKGCDVSHHQGKVDFVKMKNAGISFVYIKASENNWVAEGFREQWEAAKDAGLLRGAYHFYNLCPGSVSAKEQGKFFSETIADDPGELRPALDFENPGSDGYPDLPQQHKECERIVRQFSEKVEGNLGIWPMIYLCLDGVNRLTPLTAQIAALDLWIAWYNTNYHTPRIGAWPNWRFWQYKPTGYAPAYGVAESKGLDMDVFNGTVSDLYDYARALKRSKHLFHW